MSRTYTTRDGTIWSYDGSEWNILKTSTTKKNSETAALPDKLYKYNFDGDFKLLERTPVFLVPPNFDNKGNIAFVGNTVWDGAVHLSRFLEAIRIGIVDEAVPLFGNVLELGAGVGLAGLSAAALGAEQVHLTDLTYCRPTLQNNIQKNDTEWSMSENPDVKKCAYRTTEFELDWKTFGECDGASNAASNVGSYSLILAADVIWIDNLIKPFVKTLKCLLERQYVIFPVMSMPCRVKLPLIILAHQVGCDFTLCLLT
eukprot:Filipodium_phascolosomae@DN5709_c0_g1_i1.p1